MEYEYYETSGDGAGNDSKTHRSDPEKNGSKVLKTIFCSAPKGLLT